MENNFELPEGAQLPEGVTPEVFGEAFKAVTGLESVGQIQDLRSYRDRFDALNQELEALKSATPESPFANDFSRNIDSMIREGKNPADLVNYVQLQMQDFGAMDHEVAIKQHMKLSNPGLTDQEVNALFESEFSLPDEDDEGYERAKVIRSARIKTKGNEAKNALMSMKADMTLPERGQPQRNVELEAAVASTTKMAQSLAKSITKIPVSVVDEKAGINYTLDYQPNIPDEEMASIVSQVAKSHAGRGTRLDEAGLQSIRDDIRFLIEAKTMKDREEAIVRDAWASASEYFAQYYSNPGAVRKGAQGTPPPKKEEAPVSVKHKGRTFY